MVFSRSFQLIHLCKGWGGVLPQRITLCFFGVTRRRHQPLAETEQDETWPLAIRQHFL
jgi:hypothetical protein